MSNKINTNIPNNTVIGARQITNQFRNLNLSREAMDYLASIGGTFRLEISGESQSVSHHIVDREGKFLSTTREFEQLAGYKAFILKTKEQKEATRERDEKVATLFHLKGVYETRNGQNTCPARMLEANISKIGQFEKSLKIINKNLEVIESLPNGDIRTYLLNQGAVLQRIYIRAMSDCTGPNKYEQSTHDELLLGCCIPKFLEQKFTDPNFTKDVKNDATPLLFPRGNYMKTISFQTREAMSDAMLRANNVVILNSHSIIQLARDPNVRDWFIPRGGELTDELDAQWDKFPWPMLAAGTVDEFLEPRLNRVNVKVFTPTTAPKPKPGQKGFRPESPFQREVRELKNLQQKLLSTLLDFYHLIPRVEDPLADFWCLFCDTTNWVISPEMTIYHWLNEAGNRDAVIGSIKNNDLALIRRRMADIVLMNLNIPRISSRSRALKDIILNLGRNDTNTTYNDTPPIQNSLNQLPTATMNDLVDTSIVTEQIRNQINIFRGKHTEELLSSDRTRALVGKKRLSKTTKQFLRGIQNRELKESIETWIRENFRSSKMQELVAEYATMAIEDEDLGYNESENETSSSEDED